VIYNEEASYFTKLGYLNYLTVSNYLLDLPDASVVQQYNYTITTVNCESTESCYSVNESVSEWPG